MSMVFTRLIKASPYSRFKYFLKLRRSGNFTYLRSRSRNDLVIKMRNFNLDKSTLYNILAFMGQTFSYSCIVLVPTVENQDAHPKLYNFGQRYCIFRSITNYYSYLLLVT